MRARTGFTLVETLIAIVLVSLLMMIVFPKVSTALAKNDLRGARTTVINATAAARAAAMESARVTWLKFEGNRAVVLARPRRVDLAGSNADTIGTVHDLGKAYGVAIASTADSIRFNPSGFGSDLGASQTITLWRGYHGEVIKVDGFGRVTK